MPKSSATADEPADCAFPSHRASLCVIVPVRNEARRLAGTLDQLVAQEVDDADVEILVVDGRSTDATRDIAQRYAERYPRIRVLDNPKRLSSGARNVGVRATDSDYVVVIDGHCEIRNRRYLQDVVDIFERSGADCLGRPQPLDVTGATALQRAIALARESRLGHHPDSFIYSREEVDCPAISVAVAYRRSVFERVGEFDERFDACEDCEFNHRVDLAGLRCRLAPSLAVHYHPRGSLGGLFRQLTRYGQGRMRLFRKHPSAWSWPALVPAAFLAGVLGGPLVGAAFPILWPLYWGVLALYAAAVLTESLRLAVQSRDLSALPWLPSVFATIHAGSGWGLLREAVGNS